MYFFRELEKFQIIAVILTSPVPSFEGLCYSDCLSLQDDRLSAVAFPLDPPCTSSSVPRSWEWEREGRSGRDEHLLLLSSQNVQFATALRKAQNHWLSLSRVELLGSQLCLTLGTLSYSSLIRLSWGVQQYDCCHSKWVLIHFLPAFLLN